MRKSTFNIVHVGIAIFMVAVATSLISGLNSLSIRNRGHGCHSSQLRGIHQGLVTYSHSNKGWYPGLSSNGDAEAIGVERRFQLLLEADMFTPEYAISPSESEPIKEWGLKNQVNNGNYSYAMLQVPASGGRHSEWHATLQAQAIVVSDRNTGTTANPTSIHNEDDDSDWRGSVLWNDNHVAFEKQNSFETKYGEGKVNPADDLFQSNSPDDALMIHSGN